MSTVLPWIALVTMIVMVVALVRRIETRLVLIAAGLFLSVCSLNFMGGLQAFAKAMTNSTLVTTICSSMGFAFVSSYTQSDRSLVYYLSRPIKSIGIFLIPICTIFTFFVGIAIPSASGCAAAVGSTLIPLMLRSGIKPAAAAASILLGTMGGILSPGAAHNPYVAKLAGIEVMDFIASHAPYTFMSCGMLAVGLTIVCYLLGDHKGEKVAEAVNEKANKEDNFVPSPIKAIVPLVPIGILLVGNLWIPALKMGVSEAMIIGAIVALVCARANPSEVTKQFFAGMGRSYANIIGIIIAAGVFVAGLRSSGAIDLAVDALKESNEYARWGGSLGPWIMGAMTGSGDSMVLAFNEAVTPHAKDFGLTIEGLGGLAFISGVMGRTSSPIAGVTILVAGLAMVDPLSVIKRTIIPCLVVVVTMALIMV